MLHSEEACAGSCSPLQEQQLGSARWEGEPCRERACRAANRREKMRLDIEKKNIQSENNWAEQASRGGSCTAEGSDKPESQRSDDEIVCAMPACSQTPRGERRAAPQALPTTTHPTCRRQPDTSAVWVSSQQQRITAHAHLEKLSFLPPVKVVHRNALC